MKYVLMFAGSVADQEAWDNLPKEQLAAAYERVNGWFEENSKAGRIVGGEELRGPSSSTTVRIKDGKAIVTEAPFIEAKEVMGGFAAVEGEDFDAALAMAHAGHVGGIRAARPMADRSEG